MLRMENNINKEERLQRVEQVLSDVCLKILIFQ